MQALAKVEAKPWDRLENETDEAWLAFRCYRDMPLPRQAAKTSVVAAPKIFEWYSTYRWAERAKAFDQVFEKIKDEEREALMRQSAREIAIDHMALLSDARELASRELSKLVQSSRETQMHGLLRPRDLQKMIEMTVKLDRLVHDQSTENVAQNVTDLSKLSIDELRELRRLQRKAGVSVDEE